MKICILLPLYTVTSFLSICFPRAYTFLAPWLEVFQAVALGSFFLLLCEFISKDSATEIDIFFVAFEAPQKKGKSHITGLEWFRVCVHSLSINKVHFAYLLDTALTLTPF